MGKIVSAAQNIERKKAVIFAPFWRMAGHVGNNRVERFVRWLAEDDFEVIIIRAGTQEDERIEAWGVELTVVDRLGLHPDPQPSQASSISPRKPNKWRRALAYWLFNPDPGVMWAKAAARHPKVLSAMRHASFILSSSPPESSHVGAWMLSRKTGVPHIMDMRDGWLDEPLRPLLHTSALRRWQERRLESCIAEAADAILVTSDVWKDLFDARYPQLACKVHVLTNAYPLRMPEFGCSRPNEPNEELVLIHAGRFTGSRLTQSPDLLLEPLLKNLSLRQSKGVIRFYGDLSPEERALINSFQAQYSEIGWRLEFSGSLPRVQMLEKMQQADGLLLLSASHAALPSKIFEYIASRKPIFAVVSKKSAASKICSLLPQCSIVSVGQVNAVGLAEPFYLRCHAQAPDIFSEEYLRARFLSGARKIIRGAPC